MTTSPPTEEHSSQARFSQNVMRDAALEYAKHGHPVFPLHSPTTDSGGISRCSCGDTACQSVGKHPRTGRGFKDATTDEATIRDWWTKWPRANIGMPTGAVTGCVVVDVDPRNGGDQTLERLVAEHGALPATALALTGGGGQHILFKHPGGNIKSRKFADGLDCKADGGYIVVEPSVHGSGKSYAWELSSRLDEVALADVPEWLIVRIRAEAARTPHAAPSGPGGRIPSGKRNETLTSLAGGLRRKGFSPAAIQAAVSAENAARCDPPLVEAEVFSIVASVLKYPAGGAPVAWDQPAPLFSAEAPVAFPLDTAFPETLADLRGYIHGLAGELQVPVDLGAMLVIAIVSATVSKKFELEPRPGWREPAPIWVLVLLESGDRKSVAFRRLTLPISEWERDEAARLGPELAAAREEREVLEQRRKHARQRAALSKEVEKESAEGEAKELARQIASLREDRPPTLMTTEATSEGLVELMVCNGERALVASAEGDAIEVIMGRYDDKGKPNIGIWLNGYSGDRVRVHRRNRPEQALERPALSVALTVQPEAVRGMFASRAARGRGLLARFFPSVPSSMVGHRTINAPPVHIPLEVHYRSVVRRLLDAPMTQAPTIVKLSPESTSLFHDFEVWVEGELQKGRGLGDRRDWGAKLCGGILRIALVLHCIEEFGLTGAERGKELGAHTLKAALSWAPYLIDHERRTTEIVGCDLDTATAELILSWLQRQREPSFTRRDCFTACRGRSIQRVEDLDGGLNVLKSLGYVRLVDDSTSTKIGRPSVRYEVNPLWNKGGAA